jgi:hypothetical protein
MTRRAVVVAAVVLAALVGVVVYRTLCGCVTGVQAATNGLRATLGEVARLEQAYRQQHGRYTADLAELSYAGARDSVTLTEVSDTVLQADGVSSLVRNVSCSLRITPDVTDPEPECHETR